MSSRPSRVVGEHRVELLVGELDVLAHPRLRGGRAPGGQGPRAGEPGIGGHEPGAGHPSRAA